MKVVFSDRAYAAVLAETTEKIQTETGGLFLGTVQDDTWYIIEAIDPGPKSIFEVAYFEYDQKYTQHLINKVANLYAKQLALIGLWHRHPGSFDQFSSTDDGTNAKYAAMRKEGAISALVNIDPDFRITMYQVDRPCRYSKIPYEVGNHLIPDEYLQFKTPEQYAAMMDHLLHRGARPAESDYHKAVSLASFMNFILPYIQQNQCDQVETNNLLANESAQEAMIDEIVDDLTFMADQLGVETAMTLSDQCLTVYQEAIDRLTKLEFSVSVVKEATVLTYEDKHYLYQRGMLTEAFGNAKAAKEVTPRSQPKKQPRGINSVMKIIRFYRKEE